MKQQIFKLGLGLLISTFVFTACKKDKVVKNDEITPTTNRNELTKDSMFLYAKELYLWNKDLPTYGVFNPRQYNSSTDNLANLENVLFAITRYGINPVTGKAFEYNPDYPEETKYSFLEDLVASGKLTFAPSNIAAVDFNGQGDGFGYSLAIDGNSKSDYKIYFQFVSPGSPCALKGLGRGDYINQINGRTIGTNYDAEIDFIIAAVDQNTITIGGKKKDNSSYSYTLTKTKYTSSPIYKDSIYTNGTKKIGYLAYAKFTDENNSKAALTAVFSKFASANVTDLVIDLRYNPGGYVSTAEDLLNLIAPSSLNNKVMFVEAYNETLQSGKASILRNQPIRDQSGKIVYVNGKIANYADNASYDQASNTTYFSKQGALNNINKVVFITTDNTASASELVINSLKPYLNVKTVGSTSYGKPVGFFPVRIDKYDMYLSSFSTTNSLGEGNYFAGITPDATTADDVKKDFGNTTEASLAAAILYITSDKFTNATTSSKVTVNSTQSESFSKSLYTPTGLKGMIDTPKPIQ